MMKKRLIACCLAAACSSGCNFENLKSGEAIGSIAGGVLGAAIGNKACENSKNRDACTLLGGIAGGMLGKAIGKKLDEQDRQRHAVVTSEVLADKNRAASGSWQNPSNGTSGRVEVVNESRRHQTTQIPVLKSAPPTVKPLELIGEIYSTSKNVNVRVGPGTDYQVSPPSLIAGEQFNVIGRVIDEPNWLMIAEQGAARGYVYAPLVEPTGMADAMISGQSAVSDSVSVDTVKTCRTVNHEITYKSGQKETQTVEMCQRGDGSWDIV